MLLIWDIWNSFEYSELPVDKKIHLIVSVWKCRNHLLLFSYGVWQEIERASFQVTRVTTYQHCSAIVLLIYPVFHLFPTATVLTKFIYAPQNWPALTFITQEPIAQNPHMVSRFFFLEKWQLNQYLGGS